MAYSTRSKHDRHGGTFMSNPTGVSRRSLTLATGIAIALAAPAGLARADAFADQLKSTMSSVNSGVELKIMTDVYGKGEWKPIWFDANGPTKRAKIFLARLKDAERHGLEPSHYDTAKLAQAVENYDASKRSANEIAMSRSFMRYAADVNAGRVSPATQLPGIYIRPVRPDPERLLLAAGTVKDFAKYIDSLPPHTPQYARLVKALAFYRGKAQLGGWKPVAAGPTLKPGMRGSRVAQIRARLVVSGDLKSLGAEPQLYDAELVTAVKRFQYRHGLVQDGNVGKGTTAAMNVPIEARIRQIELNLERRRWMPDDLGDRYVFVNIADQQLKVVVNANSAKPKTVHVSRVIVGKFYRKTPIFSGMMSFMRFNPYWNVPQSIARKDLLPKIKRNPGYLNANNYLLLQRPLQNDTAVSPASVDWSSMTARNFPYYLRQKPGPWNALGTMIFMFPNPHNVFIHDTNGRGLFSRQVRYFSSGCIRLHKPWELAKIVLKANKGKWDKKRIDKLVKTREEKQIGLAQKIPVHLTYLTAWSNKDGTHHFRRDVYIRDKVLRVALKKAVTRSRAVVKNIKIPGSSG